MLFELGYKNSTNKDLFFNGEKIPKGSSFEICEIKPLENDYKLYFYADVSNINKFQIMDVYEVCNIIDDINKEFSISYDEAKLSDFYYYNTIINKHYCNDRNKFIVSIKEMFEKGDDVLAQLEFGNIDIEFTMYDICDNDIDAGFFVCVKRNENDNNSWESHEFSELVFNFHMLENIEKMESIMFEAMIKHAKKHNLYWSKSNV